MFQNSSIEEVPVLSDRHSIAEAELRNDAEVWLEREIAPLTESLRYGDPESNWVLQTFQKTLRKPATSADVPPLRCLETFDFGYSVRRIVIHPDGETLATVGSPTRHCSSDSTNMIQVWNWRTGERLFALTGHSAPITAIALSQDGKTLVSGSVDRLIKVWDFQTGQERTTLQGHNGPVRTIAISPTGKTVISSGCDQGRVRDRAIRIWDVASGSIPRIVSCLTDAPWLRMDESETVFVSLEKRLDMVSVQTGAAVLTRDGAQRWVALSSNYQTAAAVVGHEVHVRQVQTDVLRASIPLDRRDRSIQAAALSPDGQRFVAAFARTQVHPKLGSYLPAQNLLRIWQTETGESLGSLSQEELGQGIWQFVEFSPDSRLLFTSVGNTLKVWQ